MNIFFTTSDLKENRENVPFEQIQISDIRSEFQDCVRFATTIKFITIGGRVKTLKDRYELYDS